MNEDDVRKYPAMMIPLPDANKFLHIGRVRAYDLINAGEYPLELVRQGCRWYVRKTDLMKYLGISARA